MKLNPVVTILSAMILISLAVPFGFLSAEEVTQIEILLCLVAWGWAQILKRNERTHRHGRLG